MTNHTINHSVQAVHRHKQAQRAMLAVLRRYQDVPSLELLAISAQITGQIAGLSSLNNIPAEQVTDTVLVNVQIGMKEHTN